MAIIFSFLQAATPNSSWADECPATAPLVRDARINVSGFWRYLGHPVVHDDAMKVWVLGASAGDRAAALQSTEAPDFCLPDLAGKMTTLSELRGKKVFLATWASW